jgi:hypothetical protein
VRRKLQQTIVFGCGYFGGWRIRRRRLGCGFFWARLGLTLSRDLIASEGSLFSCCCRQRGVEFGLRVIVWRERCAVDLTIWLRIKAGAGQARPLEATGKSKCPICSPLACMRAWHSLAANDISAWAALLGGFGQLRYRATRRRKAQLTH